MRACSTVVAEEVVGSATVPAGALRWRFGGVAGGGGVARLSTSGYDQWWFPAPRGMTSKPGRLWGLLDIKPQSCCDGCGRLLAGPPGSDLALFLVLTSGRRM